MISWLLDSIGALVVDALNALISALAAVLATAISLLPDMPSLPTPPSSFTMAEAWVAWVIPVDQIVLALDFVITMYILWFAISIALRWAKAARGNS